MDLVIKIIAIITFLTFSYILSGRIELLWIRCERETKLADILYIILDLSVLSMSASIIVFK